METHVSKGPRVIFTVEPDGSAWASCTADQRAAWVDEMIDALAALAYVAGAEVVPAERPGGLGCEIARIDKEL